MCLVSFLALFHRVFEEEWKRDRKIGIMSIQKALVSKPSSYCHEHFAAACSLSSLQTATTISRDQASNIQSSFWFNPQHHSQTKRIVGYRLLGLEYRFALHLKFPISSTSTSDKRCFNRIWVNKAFTGRNFGRNRAAGCEQSSPRLF